MQRSLVIDMLAPLKLDFTPEAYALPLTEQQATMFRACGITGFHNSVGVGGPTGVRRRTLNSWPRGAALPGAIASVFSLVGRAEDLDHAKAQQKIAVIMGLQNADEFREAKDVKKFYQLGLRCAQLTYNTQNLHRLGIAPSASTAVSATSASRSSRR